MSDAAQGEPKPHPAFKTPFKVEPKFETWKTPQSYRGYYGGKTLPDEVKVWRVQNTGKDYGSVVSSCAGLEDSPDAEILTPGYNRGKANGDAGVSRQGNFLQWGFCGSPSQMTEAGRNFFLNCLCYISRFDGKTPLVRKQCMARSYILTLAGLIARIKNPSWFPPDVIDQYRADPDGLVKHLADNVELISYQDGKYVIDEDLSALGIASNRKLATLEKLIALLDEPAQSAVASKLLRRYTTESFETAQQWRQWLADSRNRIYFTDDGGYKFMAVPKEW
jgi:hypothetical protein